MFDLDFKVFQVCQDYCKFIGKGFGFNGALEGSIIIGFIVVGTILIAINKAGVKNAS